MQHQHQWDMWARQARGRKDDKRRMRGGCARGCAMREACECRDSPEGVLQCAPWSPNTDGQRSITRRCHVRKARRYQVRRLKFDSPSTPPAGSGVRTGEVRGARCSVLRCSVLGVPITPHQVLTARRVVWGTEYECEAVLCECMVTAMFAQSPRPTASKPVAQNKKAPHVDAVLFLVLVGTRTSDQRMNDYAI